MLFTKAIKQVLKEFSTDNILKYSASLAYYTVFSIAPLLVIIISLSGVFFGKDAVQGEVFSQLNEYIGSASAAQIQNIIKNIHLSGNSFFATIISGVVLVIGASTIFGEIQDSLNKIWGLRIKRQKGWWKLILTRLLSFSIIVVMGILMMVSLVLNTLFSAFEDLLGAILPGINLNVVGLANNLISFIIAALLFSLMFKILPDAKVPWKDVLVGGFVTSFLFSIGKWAIGLYLGKSNYASVYGAAGSIVIFMVWVYYSSVILYLGAEFTKVYAKLYGNNIKPNEFAEWVLMEKKPVTQPQLKNKDLS